MKPQRFEIINQRIRDAFLEKKALYPDQMRKRLKFSWSNWGFGLEDFAVSCARLEKAGIRFIELHGNHYGSDLGYHPEEIRTILADHGITCAGVCGMFSADNDLSSNRHIQRQAAIDYIKREVAFTAEMGGKYMLVCPAAEGRSKKYDDSEIERSIDSLSRVAHVLAALPLQHGSGFSAGSRISADAGSCADDDFGTSGMGGRIPASPMDLFSGIPWPG